MADYNQSSWKMTTVGSFKDDILFHYLATSLIQIILGSFKHSLNVCKWVGGEVQWTGAGGRSW